MKIITITSDWGLSDHYVASVKGLLINRVPEAQIVDITHSIPKFGLVQAAFILKNTYKNFPEGSIHIIGVNSEEIADAKDESKCVYHKIVLYNKHFFIGADNGIFSLICDSKPDKIIKLSVKQELPFYTFPAYTLYANAAVQIAKGVSPEKLGEKTEDLYKLSGFKPLLENNSIKGLVVYIDSYDNAITNISYDDFVQVRRNRKFTVYVKNEIFDTINKTYAEVPIGELVLVWNSLGLLEIAQNRGNLHNLFGINIHDTVRIEFSE